MPELPEVESTRLHIQKISLNRKIVDVYAPKDTLVFDHDSAEQIKKSLLGAKIIGSDRRGKYFWLKLNRKPWPVFHLGMTGSLDTPDSKQSFHGPKKKAADPKNAEASAPKKQSSTQLAAELNRERTKQKSLRLEFVLDNGTRILFKDPRRFGRIRLAADPLKEEPISLLGYDPLIHFPTAGELHKILTKRKAPIKAILLDQSLFAGVGNWIADEVLYQSKLSPHRLGSSLTSKEVQTLRTKVLSIVRHAVKVSADKDKFPKTWLFHHRWSKPRTRAPQEKNDFENLSRKSLLKKLNAPAKIKPATSPTTDQNEKIIFETIGGRTTAWVPTLQK